jgi:predicted amidohydrolase YtcJ
MSQYCHQTTSVIVGHGRIPNVDSLVDGNPDPDTKTINLAGRRVIPALNDPRPPVIRGGQNFIMELPRDGAYSLPAALQPVRNGVKISQV